MASKKKKSTEGLAPQTDPKAPLDGAAFLAAAQKTLKALAEDLLARADGSASITEGLKARWAAEQEKRRTGDAYEPWRRRFVVQVGVAWILGCVFARTLEDRGLVDRNRVAGPGAADSVRQFLDMAPHLTEREYLLTVFRELANLRAARDLFDARHNPVWKLAPSADGAKLLMDLFRGPDAEAPAFRFGQSDTRFLGDLYQDLSDEVRERFALLQTPRFVESFILDQTLEPAIKEFGLDQATIIDPTCGSGHFLLGAFERLVDHRLRAQPGLDVREATVKALDAVHGADINPYAAASARFRLVLAFLERGSYGRIEDAPELPIHVVVGDSLLHGRGSSGQEDFAHVAGTDASKWKDDLFALEDEAEAKRVLRKRYAAVVGNPPYITVKDAVLREEYRKLYPNSAIKQYSLAAPFSERFLDLAREGGFIGVITANSFMKREFGKRLIEEVFARHDLTHVISTETAHIPGHGTPTVILFGRNRTPTRSAVVSVAAKRAEIPLPVDAARGLVWRSIVEHLGEETFENDFISVSSLDRQTLARHPWALGGGGASELKQRLEERTATRLIDLVEVIGFGAVTREDDVFVFPRGTCARMRVDPAHVAVYGYGEAIRDWSLVSEMEIVFPYDTAGTAHSSRLGGWMKVAWLFRTQLWLRQGKGFKTKREAGGEYYEYSMFYPGRHFVSLKIAFAFVATHNHFFLDRGGRVFNRSAPVMKLLPAATEDEHLALLAYLNSSTACFWMKQVCFQKSAANARGEARDLPERISYEFAGTPLQQLPIPTNVASLSPLARRMEALARERAEVQPAAVVGRAAHGSLARELAAGAAEDLRILREMKSLQAETDLAVFDLFALDSASRSYLEQPVFARQWRGVQGQFHLGEWTYDELTTAALWRALADETERAVQNHDHAVSLSGLLRDLRGAKRVEELVGHLGERLSTIDEAGAIVRVVAEDAVPFLSALRLNEAGLEKHTRWLALWDAQRVEDEGPHAGETAVQGTPPAKYDEKDYLEFRTWQLRGKLDVPKERFISYPGCESDEDKSPVYGWAGWDHLQRAQALSALYQKRKNEEAWGKDRLTPMLAGLQELVPWLKQWHNEPDPNFGGERLGNFFADFVASECQTLGLTLDDLKSWRPPAKTRGVAKKKTATKANVSDASPPSTDDEAPPSAPKKKRAKKRATPPDEGEVVPSPDAIAFAKRNGFLAE